MIGIKLYNSRCAKENKKEDNKNAVNTPKFYLKAGYRNPLKKISSQKGATTAVTIIKILLEIFLLVTSSSILLGGASIPKIDFKARI